jgi:hypothetical protein
LGLAGGWLDVGRLGFEGLDVRGLNVGERGVGID